MAQQHPQHPQPPLPQQPSPWSPPAQQVPMPPLPGAGVVPGQAAAGAPAPGPVPAQGFPPPPPPPPAPWSAPASAPPPPAPPAPQMPAVPPVPAAQPIPAAPAAPQAFPPPPPPPSWAAASMPPAPPAPPAPASLPPVPAPPAPAPAAPSAAVDDDPFGDDLSDATIVVARAGTATAWQLIDTDGTAFALHATNVLGRRPSAEHAAQNAQLVALSDPGKVLSRTHASVDVTDGTLWVVDLDSTNGTDIIENDGTVSACVPGTPYTVPADASLSLGGRIVSFAAPQP